MSQDELPIIQKIRNRQKELEKHVIRLEVYQKQDPNDVSISWIKGAFEYLTDLFKLVGNLFEEEEKHKPLLDFLKKYIETKEKEEELRSKFK